MPDGGKAAGSARYGNLAAEVNALEVWSQRLGALALPPAILAAAPEDPWRFPPGLAASWLENALRQPASVSHQRTMEVLPAGGVLLDVGVGGGASSLPAAAGAGLVIGVDQSAEMLEAFARAAGEMGVRSAGELGTWPQVADAVPVADVVVSHHTLYNVADLAPFVTALVAHARLRIVLELTERHPLAWMDDLWLHFHGHVRPRSPTAEDAVAALTEIGYAPRIEHGADRRPGSFPDRASAIRWIGRRLCLPEARDREVAERLGERLAEGEGRWSIVPRQSNVTLWWETGTPEATRTPAFGSGGRRSIH